MPEKMEVDELPSYSKPIGAGEAGGGGEVREQKHPYLTDLDENLEVEEYGEFRWHIENYSRLKAKAQENPDEHSKVYSPDFEIGGEKWRLLMFPNGNNSDCIALYLDYSQSKSMPDNRWHRCAQLALRICHYKDDTSSYHKVTQHRFSVDETDWGFTSFIRFAGLSTPIDGNKYSLLDKDQFYVHAYVRVVKDPTGTLWHTFNNWDSKRETGFVGLKNQGATCYMNSLLQSLYFTNYFRKAVFKIPTDGDDPTNSVALALQRVFYNLQHENDAVDTRELTKSFGWDSLDAFMQHDVQEFNRVLQDSLENKMKKTLVEGAIEKLFVGKMKSYIKCVNVEYESSRDETYYDIQLNVKGKKDLSSSFEDYIEVEMLDGDNKYQAEGHGLQDAKKGVIFTSFPPVLHLQLKRFEYDFMHDAMVKINDRHEYPMEIDLSRFMDSSVADQSLDQTFVLHGVLVHSGDVNGGHYRAFLRPTIEDRWFKFDDDLVIPVTHKEVFEDNFGDSSKRELGDSNNGGTPPLHTRRMQILRRFTNAYMLVYVRKSDRATILGDVTDADVPEHLAATLKEEAEVRERLAKEAAERHLFVDVRVMTEDDLKNYHGCDLCDFDDTSAGMHLKIKRTMTLDQFTKQVATQIKEPAGSIRFWNFYRRQNKTVRPEQPIDISQFGDSTMEEVYRKLNANYTDLRLLLEVSSGQHKNSKGQVVPFPEERSDHLTVFFKYYDPQIRSLQYVGHLTVPNGLRGLDLVGTLNELKGFPRDSPLRLFEEIKPTMIYPIKLRSTLQECEMMRGDIICFQKDFPGEMEKDLSAISHYEYLIWRVAVEFRPKKSNLDSPTTDGAFTLELSRKMTYDQVAAQVAAKIDGAKERIRFFVNASGGEMPKTVVKRVENQTLHEILQSTRYSTRAPLFWFEELDIAIKELDSKAEVSLLVVGEGLKEKESLSVLVSKEGTAADVVRAMESKGPEYKQMTLFDVADSLEVKQVELEEPVNSLVYIHRHQIIATARPNDIIPNKGVPKADLLITVFHFDRDISLTHSIPFMLDVFKTFTVADVKKSVQAILGISDKEFSKVRLALYESWNRSKFLEDDTEEVFKEWKEGYKIGIDHSDKRSRNVLEKAIKIK